MNIDPNYDILGLEKGASADEISAGYRRLEIVFERDGELESPEFADIQAAFAALPLSAEEIDRKVWEWVTWKDKDGEWNTLVRKAHKLKKKASAAANWSNQDERNLKRDKMRGRKQERDRRGGGGYSED